MRIQIYLNETIDLDLINLLNRKDFNLHKYTKQIIIKYVNGEMEQTAVSPIYEKDVEIKRTSFAIHISDEKHPEVQEFFSENGINSASLFVKSLIRSSFADGLSIMRLNSLGIKEYKPISFREPEVSVEKILDEIASAPPVVNENTKPAVEPQPSDVIENVAEPVAEPLPIGSSSKDNSNVLTPEEQEELFADFMSLGGF